MGQQTAVIRLEEKLKTYLSWSSFLEEDFEQAKQMEKEQIIEAFTKGELVKDNYYDYTNPFNIKGQIYYKNTYENNK